MAGRWSLSVSSSAPVTRIAHAKRRCTGRGDRFIHRKERRLRCDGSTSVGRRHDASRATTWGEQDGDARAGVRQECGEGKGVGIAALPETSLEGGLVAARGRGRRLGGSEVVQG